MISTQLLKLREMALALVAACVWMSQMCPSSVASTAVDDEARQFLAENCLDCHVGEEASAGLDLEKLSPDLGDEYGVETWVQVLDRVAAREMPPEDYETLEDADVRAFTGGLKKRLVDAQLDKQAREGRVPVRRLTNLQLERTLQDLLGIDIPLEREMPEEPKSDHYSTLAEAQTISHFHLQQHIKIVDLALDEAFRRALTQDDCRHREFTAKQISRTRSRTREPEYIDGQAVVWSGRLIFYGRLPATTARESGWYRFRFEVEALKKPEDHGVWCTVRSGQCVSNAPLMSWVGSFEATSDPKVVSFDAWLPAGYMLEVRPGDLTLPRARFQGGQSANGEGGRQNVPGVAINWLEMERIHQSGDDSQVREFLFGDLELRKIAASKSGKRRAKRGETAGFDFEVVSKNPKQDGRQQIAAFAPRAFRREVPEADLAPFYAIFEASLEQGEPLPQALRAAYRAMLCSARFLYFREPAGSLDDFAIANRISYFLWNSMPDQPLMRLAQDNKLHNPGVLKREVARMLETERGRQFMADFASQWLELSEIDFTEPDSKLHPDFDIVVQNAMLDETHAFLNELLTENLSVRALADSNYTYANSRLARFYGLKEQVQGDALQKVALAPEDHRGGLLTQGAVLKVTANGTNTSPVLRGLWVSRRILGRHIPEPPSNVPAIEPDIRGAKTIREQLEKHRSMDECAGCHAKIDPPGFALENFDASGKWREYYPRLKGRKKVQGAKVDSSYVTFAGQPFDGFESYQSLAAQDVQALARNVAKQMLVYATGARIGIADRDALDHIVSQAEQDDFGMRSILEQVVLSRVFLTK